GPGIARGLKRGKDVAPVWHRREPAASALVGLEAGDILPVPEDPSIADRLQTEDRAQQAGLADAVPAEEASDLAALRRDAGATQDVACTVIKVDVGGGEHLND